MQDRCLKAKFKILPLPLGIKFSVHWLGPKQVFQVTLNSFQLVSSGEFRFKFSWEQRSFWKALKYMHPVTGVPKSVIRLRAPADQGSNGAIPDLEEWEI